MNDTSWTSGASAPHLPYPTHFRPDSPDLPAELLSADGASEPVVLLVALSDDPSWAADSAVAVAATMAAAGRRVVLADLHVEEPILHERLGESNIDGIVDVFLYGASVSRSAKPARGQGFFFIPGGTYAPSAEEVYAHPRWEKLVAGFREAGATLIAFAPGTAEGWQHLARWSRGVVVLGEPSDEERARLAAVSVRSILAPHLAPTQPLTEPELPPIEEPESPPHDLREVAADEPRLPAFAEPDVDEDPFGSSLDDVVSSAAAGPPPEPVSAEWPTDDADATAADPSPVEDLPLGNPERTATDFDDWNWDVEEEVADPHLPEEVSSANRLVEADLASPRADEGLVIRVEERDEITAERPQPALAPHEPGYDEAPPPAPEAAEVEPPRSHSVVGQRRGSRGRGPRPLIWILLAALVIMAAVVIAAMVRPDLFGGAAGVGDAVQPADTLAVAGTVPPPPEAPVAQGAELPFVVQVQSYASYEPARAQAERQVRRVPEVPVYVVPEVTQGVLYYKVMAGALPDTASARLLRSRLVDAGVIAAEHARDNAPGGWSLIQHRPLAFSLGEFATRDEAQTQVDSLAARRIPAYPVGIPYSDGTERWRLYAGAFPDTLHAEDLRQMLRTAEFPTRLVTRVGQSSLPPP